MTASFPLRSARVIRAPAAPLAPAPAPAPASDPIWQRLDTDSLPEDLRQHYYAYRKALDHANQLRAVFEEETNEAFDVGATNKLAFGYKFGQLSVAIVPKAGRSAKGAVALGALARPR